MAVYAPAGVPTSGNRNVWWVDAIADTASPKVTELTSTTTAIDFSCFLPADWDGPSAEQDKDTDERWCGKKFEQMGDVTYTISELQYVVDPQAVDQQGTNRLMAFLTPNKRGYLVMRRGKSMDAPVVAGDKVDVYTVQLGVSIAMPTPSNESLKNRQGIAVVGDVQTNVAVAA